MPCQASTGGSSTSSSVTAIEVFDHQNETSGDDGNTGQELDGDGEHHEFEDGMDRLLHSQGWETDVDGEDDDENDEENPTENPQKAAQTETENPDNMETLEVELDSMDISAIESQWRLCGEQGDEGQESKDEDEKKSEQDSKDLLTTHMTRFAYNYYIYI